MEVAALICDERDKKEALLPCRHPHLTLSVLIFIKTFFIGKSLLHYGGTALLLPLFLPLIQ